MLTKLQSSLDDNGFGALAQREYCLAVADLDPLILEGLFLACQKKFFKSKTDNELREAKGYSELVSLLETMGQIGEEFKNKEKDK